jgi:mRNA interferase MazF
MGELSQVSREGICENATCETIRRSAGPMYLLAGPRSMIKRLRGGAAAPHEVSFGPISRARMKANTGERRGTRPARIDRGDVFWIEPDDSRGPVPSYSHPQVVVQDDVFNHSRITTVVVCALTSNLHRASEPGNVLLEVGEGNLPRQSVVAVSQISSVDKARLGERIGSLSGARVEQILAGLRFQQVSFFGR